MPRLERSRGVSDAANPHRSVLAHGRTRNLETAAAAIRQEYCALPGLSLTAAQAARLWHLDAVSCALVLSRLTDRGFLARARDGRFRLCGRAWPPQRALPAAD